MATRMAVALVGLATVQTLGCASTTTGPSEWDLAHHAYPEAQEELREILATIIRNAQTGNAVGLRDGHLKSDKFTKFGGRKHERLDFEQTVAGETANITTGQEYAYDVDDLKIDVFGKVAIMTFHGHVTRVVDDEPVEYTFRQTLAFLDTSDGWKIVHEHQSRREPASSQTAAPDDQFFNSDGVRIRYIDQGPRDAEPIVLVHGGAQSIEATWGTTGVIDALDDEHRVIALDCRGHGKSDKPHETKAYGNKMVADIVRLLDHLAIDKAHVVGYSMGGRIVWKLVADYPHRVISALPSGTNVEPPSEPGDGDEFVERLARSLEESGSMRPALDHFVTDGSMTEHEIDQLDAMIRATNDTRALAAVVRSLDELLPDRAKLEANNVPCLSIVGEGDPNLPITRKTAEYMANLEVEVVEGADHMTTYRDPAFVAAIRSFVREHASHAVQPAPTAPRPVVIMQPHEGDHLWSLHESGEELGSGGELQIFLDPETHPEAKASFAKYTLGVAGALPVHRHDKTEEFAYILSGEGAAVTIGDDGEEIEVPISAGYFWYNPPGAWHAVRNKGATPLVLVFAAVPNEEKGLLSFFRRISVEPGQDPIVLAPEDLERLGAERDLILRASPPNE